MCVGKIRKVAVLLMACVLLLSSYLPMQVEAYTAHTIDESMVWLNNLAKNKKKVGSGQCVALITAYYEYLGASKVNGNANTYATDAKKVPYGWQRIKGAKPQKGDIMIWTKGYNNYGHVAICGGSKVYYHQNWNGEYVEVLSSAYTSGFTIKATGEKAVYWGVIRPDFESASLNADVPAPVINSVPDGKYMIKNAGSTAYYMNVYAGKDANGTKVVSWKIDKETDDQHFKFAHQGNGSYFIYGVGLSSRVLDIYFGSNNKINLGDYLQVWKKGADNNSQLFNVVPVGNNKYVFELKSMDNAVLGLTSAANNSSITLQRYTGSDAQHWYICDYNGKTISTCDLGGHNVEQGVCSGCGEVFVAITEQPKSMKVTSGNKITAKVTATGDGLTYQWYRKDVGESEFVKSSITTASYACTMYKSYDGRQLYCVVTDENGYSVKSDTITLTLDKSVKITGQPKSVTVATGDKINTKVTATGDGLTYQWYRKDVGETQFTKSSITTATYASTMYKSYDGRQLYCVVTDQYGNSVKSNTITLTLDKTLTITGQPKSVTVAAGDKINTKVTANGEGLTYQWYRKDVGETKFTKSSITTATYASTMYKSYDGRQLYCVVTDKNGNTVKSNTITLTLDKTLRITGQPKSMTVAAGDKITAKVTANGEGLKYQWYRKDVGATGFLSSSIKTATYASTMYKSYDGRQLYCVVTDKYGNSVKSETITLTLKK